MSGFEMVITRRRPDGTTGPDFSFLLQGGVTGSAPFWAKDVMVEMLQAMRQGLREGGFDVETDLTTETTAPLPIEPRRPKHKKRRWWS